MIHINVSDEKWKEFEEYHKEYIKETVIHNWELFIKNTNINFREKAVVYKVLKKQGIRIPQKNDKEKDKKLEPLLKWCISDNIDALADVTKDKLFEKIILKKPLSEEGKKHCIGHIINILGYDKFSEGAHTKMKDGKIWCRHSFMNALGIKVCPYCNREYITSYYVSEKSHKKVRTTTDTDHYYPKSYFPLLSMNLYNMIPSCQICNSRMKLNKVKCKEEAHLYPYRDASDSLTFKVPFSDVKELYGFSENDIKIQLQEKNQDGILKRAIQSKEIFKLEQVYSAHTDIVFKLKNNMKNYASKVYEEIFCKNYTDLYGGYDNFMKVLYPFLDEDEKDRPLVKMQKDIYRYIKEKTDSQ